ncbi:MAG TPA: TlpA disulfide reductase family protein [Edaphocola sp.]|nr:TlpA disulfide reductase family protein [Edaphocola sp.]
MKKSEIGKWLKKRKWDILIYGILALILFVPDIRMPIVSTVQRIFAFSPSELPKNNQKSVQVYDWDLMTLEGSPINLSQSKEKVVLINLWATWCPPCVAEMPSLQKLYDEYKDRISFYFISNEKPEQIQKFIDKKGYTFPVYIPISNYPIDFDGNKLPTTYVISKKGKIIIEETGAHDWFSKSLQKKIENLINEKINLKFKNIFKSRRK